jgi:hypothetical protein
MAAYVTWKGNCRYFYMCYACNYDAPVQHKQREELQSKDAEIRRLRKELRMANELRKV